MLRVVVDEAESVGVVALWWDRPAELELTLKLEPDELEELELGVGRELCLEPGPEPVSRRKKRGRETWVRRTRCPTYLSLTLYFFFPSSEPHGGRLDQTGPARRRGTSANRRPV